MMMMMMMMMTKELVSSFVAQQIAGKISKKPVCEGVAG